MRKSRQQRKTQKVMHEFKAGTLRSSTGQLVTKRSQAVAIALSEAGVARPRKQRRKRR